MTKKESICRYTDYIETHRNNIKHSFSIMKRKCIDILDQYNIDLSKLESLVDNHDLSKYSDEEFEPYRRKFFLSDEDEAVDENEFEKACLHHYEYNKHHWNYWVGKVQDIPYIYVVEMTLDWIAMGIQFNNTALEYYENNKSKITIPENAEKLFYLLVNKYYN